MTALRRAWESQGLAWFTALTLVGLLYASLPWGPRVLRSLRRAGRLDLAVGAVLAAAILAALVLAIRRRGRLGGTSLALAVLALPLGAALAGLATSPQEKVHIVVYGLVGMAFLHATLLGSRSLGWAYALAALAGVATGWVDEEIQAWLPNRHYDPRDILMNGLAVLLGLYLAAALQGHLERRRP